MAIDIGTGSGSAVLRRAAREPGTLFVAIDADAAAMADASRRAAAPSNRGGRPNVVFLVAAAEAFPTDLRGIADEVTVVLPWGSLLQAALEPETATFQRIGAVLKPDALMTLLLSADKRDRLEALDERAAGALGTRYAAAGYEVTERRPATRADVAFLSSGWGRRLGIPERRSGWLFCLRLSRAATERR